MSHRLSLSRGEGAGRFVTCLLLAASFACHDGQSTDSRESSVDIRFRGVGHQQLSLSSVGVTGGPMPGLGAESAEWRGPGYMAWGIVTPDFMSIHGTQVPSDDSVRYVRQWWNGLDCSASLDAAVASNSVILGIGGDARAASTTCTLFGVGPDDTDPVTYQYLIGSSVSAAEIEAALAANDEARSFVLTAITQIDYDLYTFVAESVGAVAGRYEAYETVVRSAALGELEDVAKVLASSGYVITASSWEGGAQYTLVGTRNPAETGARSVQLVVSDPVRFTDDVAQLLAGGYSPVSVTMGRINDELVIRIIGER